MLNSRADWAVQHMAKTGVRRRTSARVARKVAADKPAATAPPRWTFLTNHSHVLILLAQDPTMVLREVAARIGITERAVQRIVAELEQDGFISHERAGRRNTYRINADRRLRHPIEEHRTIGDLVELITSGG